jgi:YVTN family beta-propeller protein
MEFRILGPIEVQETGRELPLGGAKQRALLSILLLHDGAPVSTDRLIDLLWGEHAPGSALNSVHIYVSRLRKALRNGRVVTRSGGYALEVGGDEVDLRMFERLVAEGRELSTAGNAAAARDCFVSALALWRGPALSELAGTDYGRIEIDRLEELRLLALEGRLDAELQLGRAADVVPELEALVRQHPLRERVRAQLMLALYRAGRQSEALEVYRDGRRRLTEELGLDPGPALQELERAILTQDPALEGQPRRALVSAQRRGPLLMAGSAALLIVVTVGIALQLGGGEAGLASVAPNTAAVIDPGHGRVVAQIPVGIRPGPIVASDDAVWVANLEDRSVSRLDPETKVLVRTISTTSVPTGLAVDRNRVWVAGSDGTLSWIDARYNRVRKTPVTFEKGLFYRADHQLAMGFDSVWASDPIGQVERLRRSSGTFVSRLDTGFGASGIAVGAGSVWVANTSDGTVSRIDPTGVVIATIPVGHGPTGVAFGEGAIWVVVSLDRAVARIDPETDAVTASIAAGEGPRAVVVGFGSVWIADAIGGEVLRIDPGSNEVTKTIELGSSPRGLAVVGDSIWTSISQPPSAASVDAGERVLRVEVESDPGVVDPAVSPNLQVDYATCAELLNYPDAPVPRGSRVVPDVARSMPVMSRDGLRYTFTVRPGFRFSPPSNEPVTAQTFKDTIERTLDPELDSSAGALLDDVGGVPAYRAGKAAHIAGIVASGETLTVHLTRPRGDLPARLALPYFCAVPSGTPGDPDGVRGIPMAGPYYVASYVPERELVLKQNPNYGGDRPRGPTEIRYTIGVSRASALEHVLSGRADYAGDGVPLAAQKALLRRFGPRSVEGRGGRQRFFVNPVLGLRFLALNTQRPLFADSRLRRAVSYAIDRTALARVWNQSFEAHTFGGGPPTAHLLPPGLRVSPHGVAYPLHPDLAKARALAGSKRRTAVLFTCDEPPCPQHAAILKANLAAIGIDLVVKTFPVGVMFARAAEPHAAYDLIRVGWIAEYADPAAVLDPLLQSGEPLNLSHLADPSVDRRLEDAARLTGPARARAYDALARSIAAEVAPFVVFENDTSRDFFSERVGCHVYSPVTGMDLGALCLRSPARSG